ncbi:hypothetical protein O0I10_009601, partial [Lichtheimia ornata]
MSEKLLDDTAAGSGSSAVTPEHVNINVVGSTHRKGSDDHEYEEPFDISLSKFDKENGVKTILSLVFMMVFMIGLPIALYFGLRNVLGTLYALLISGIPPLLHVIITFIRHRRLDFLGILVVLAFILSAVISLVTGDERATLLRDSATTMLIAVLFMLTLIPFRTRWLNIYPITWTIFKRAYYDTVTPYHWRNENGDRHEMPFSDFIWLYIPKARTYNYTLTAAYSIALTAAFIARVIMIEASNMSVHQIVLYGNVILGVFIAIAAIATVWAAILIQASCVKWAKANDYTEQYNKHIANYHESANL